MTQTSLLDWKPRESTQARELRRVSGRIAPHVLAFAQEHVGQEYVGADLLQFVESRVGHVAPDSPRRIMADLDARGVVRVALVDRAGSRYRIEEAELNDPDKLHSK